MDVLELEPPTAPDSSPSNDHLEQIIMRNHEKKTVWKYAVWKNAVWKNTGNLEMLMHLRHHDHDTQLRWSCKIRAPMMIMIMSNKSIDGGLRRGISRISPVP